MLLRFFTRNMLSFNEEAEFSLLAGSARQLPEHAVEDSDSGLNILKSAAIYGANGSGKSNLIKAMSSARNFIVHGTDPNESIRLYRPFKLDSSVKNQDAKIEFEFKVGQKILSYGMEFNSKRIKEEWLVEIGKTVEKNIFLRTTSEEGKTFVDFQKLNIKGKKEKMFLEFIATGTRANQPFLTECNVRNVEYFEDIYNWFRKKLRFIFPRTRFRGIEYALDDNTNSGTNTFEKFLCSFDTGITGIDKKEVNLDSELPPDFPEEIKRDFHEKLDKRNEKIILSSYDGDYLEIYKDLDENVLKARKLMSKHKMKGSSQEALFEISEESDGTRRMMDFIPMLIELSTEDCTVFVDEIDRSLHPMLTKKIVEFFFKLSAGKASQFIFTTHESSLLNFDLLRRDEIWFIEKNKDGESTMYSLEEYKPRHDKDIRKGYLLGRYGAIPFTQDIDSLGWART